MRVFATFSRYCPRRQGVWLAAVLAVAMLVIPAQAETQPGYSGRDYKIEAAFLYNFLNYITWPGYAKPEEMKEATICIYGEDPIGGYLEYVQRKMAGERSLQVYQLQKGEPPKTCQILFIRHADNASSDIIAAQGGDVLVVGVVPNFAGNGGSIGLVHEQDRIAMEIDNTALTQSGFQVSSRLLKLARKVK